MVSDAINKHGAGLVAIRKIEAAVYMVEKLNQNQNISFIQGGNTMNMLNLNQGG
jgi:HD superfamily phosphohydrolase YqeK